jgi:hypothetical protein
MQKDSLGADATVIVAVPEIAGVLVFGEENQRSNYLVPVWSAEKVRVGVGMKVDEYIRSFFLPVR